MTVNPSWVLPGYYEGEKSVRICHNMQGKQASIYESINHYDLKKQY